MKATIEVARTTTRVAEFEVEGFTLADCEDRAREMAANHDYGQHSESDPEYETTIMSHESSEGETELTFSQLERRLNDSYAVELDGDLTQVDLNPDNDREDTIPFLNGNAIWKGDTERIWVDKDDDYVINFNFQGSDVVHCVKILEIAKNA